jgi:hypothetical protein
MTFSSSAAAVPVDDRAPTYWLPAAVAATIAAHGLDGYEVTLRMIEAIPAAARAICAASEDVDEPGFRLVGRGRSRRQPG